MAKYIVQMRRGTATQWADSDIKPLAGEIVVEIDETNNLHKLKIGDGEHTYSELAYLQAGDEIVTQVIAEIKPRIVTVDLTLNWTGADGKYSQIIELEGITGHSRLDLQPNVDMLAEFKQLGLAFVTENNSGVITVYSVGNMPLKSYKMQATIVEADCSIEDPILGIPVGGSAEITKVSELTNDSGFVTKVTTDLENYYTKEEIDSLSDKNIEDGPTTGIHQIADKVADGFDFTGKNPNATVIEPTLTGTIPYGATGPFAAAFGGKSSAQGKRSMAVGTTTIAKGNYSFAAGDNSVALGNDSAVFGYQNTAKGQASFATGSGTQATGNASASFGKDTVAEGDYSLATGFESEAKHFGSIVLGKGLETVADDQVVVGRYNDTSFSDDDNFGAPIFTVGCGESNDFRNNAFTIASDGTIFKGDYPYENKSNHIGSLYESREYVWPEAEGYDENEEYIRHLGTHVPIQSVTDTDINYGSLTVAKSWAGADTLAQRTTAGQIIAADPTEDKHLATKGYVDDKFDNIASEVNSGSIAYTHNVPENSLGYAKINKFGGMSYKSKNLIPFPYDFTGTDESNFSISIDTEQRLIVSGVPTSEKVYTLKEISLPIGSYFLTAIQTSTVTRVYLYKNGTLMWSHANTDDTFAFTVDSVTDVYKIAIIALPNNSFNADIIAPMISRDIALPYEPYGLRHAKPTAFKSAGANLIPYTYSNYTQNGITWTPQPDGSVLANGTATDTSIYILANFTFEVPAGTYTFSGTPQGSFTTYYMQLATEGYAEAWNATSGTSFTLNKGSKLIVQYVVEAGVTVNNLRLYPMLNRGDTALPYSPYKKSTLALPTAVLEKCDGLDYGVNANAYNYVEWTESKKKYHKVCNVIDLGTLDWYSTSGFMVSGTGLINAKATNNEVANILCAKYTNTSYNGLNSNANKHIAIRESDKSVWVLDTDYTDSSAFKTAMQGVILVYELAIPEIIDISDILPDANSIAVQANGSITAINDSKLATPIDITYYEGESKIIGAEKIIGSLIGTADRAISDANGNDIIDTYAAKDELYTKQEIDEMIANAGSGESVDLSDYYTKSETYNRSEIDTIASDIETSVYEGISTEGWYRIAEYHSSSLSDAKGGSGYGCTITIRRSYSYKSSEVHSLQLVAGYDQSFIQSLHDYAPVAQLITAARHTVDTNTNTAYFEIYYNPDGSSLEGLRVTVSDGRIASRYDPGWKAIEPTQTDSEFSSGIYMIGEVYKIPSKAQILTSGSEIAEGTDLNTIIIPGYYKCSGNVYAQTLTNCPTQLAFFMRVGEHAGTYQEIIEYVTDNPTHFYRNCYDGEWGSWERILTTENISSIPVPKAELANRISVKDTRDETLLPNSETLPIDSVCAFFTNQDMPTSHWTSGLSVKGWGHDYTTWQLASNSDSYGDDLNLYMRSGRNDTWNEWRRLPFADEVVSNTELADIKNLATKGVASYTYTETISESKFFKISINDYNHWMMGFTISTYQGYVSRDIRISGYNYASEHWYEPKAILVSASAGNDTPVYFGYDSDFHLWVAISAQNYAGISIQDVVVGYREMAVDENLFTITLVDSLNELGTIQSTQQVYRPATINEVMPKSGGTFDGTITTAPAKWRVNNESGLDLNNSDIIGVNTLYLGDSADACDEGIAFPRPDVASSKQYDIFRMHAGKAYVDTITLSDSPVSSNLRELLDDKNYTAFVYTKAEVDQKIASAITSAINASY